MAKFYVYFIPYEDKNGKKMYCGHTNNPIRREVEHDLKRFSRKCPCCKGTGFRPKDHPCYICKGKARLPSRRKKTGRMHVVPKCINANGVYIHDDVLCRDKKSAMRWERVFKNLCRDDKLELYNLGFLPENVPLMDGYQ